MEELPFVGERGPLEANTDAVLADWRSLFDGCLIASRQALTWLAQHFLIHLSTHLLPSKDCRRQGVCTVWVDEFTEWTPFDARTAEQAFARVDQSGSPVHELTGRQVILTGWPWSSLYAADGVSTPWLAGPIQGGQTNGRLWLRVPLNPWLLPYLRRLGICYREAAADCHTAWHEAQQPASARPREGEGIAHPPSDRPLPA